MTDRSPVQTSADLLIQALPHMLRYDEATIVVKYGGHAMGDEHMARAFARDMVLLEQAPVANAADGQTYNINADTFAGAVAGKLKAKRLLFLTDVPGVLDKNKQLIKELKIDQIHALIADGTITGGMIPKVETCIYALEQGVEGVVILDGQVPHAVLLELLTDHGSGTLITR